MTAGRDGFLLHEHFEAQARETPDSVALRHNERSITFAQLGASSARLAGSLRARGIRDGASVGLHMERSIDYVIALLGVLRANGSVVPLPPSYPRSRLHDILSFGALAAVVDHGDTPLDSTAADSILHFSDPLADGGDADTNSSDATSGDPDQPAFVLCSSGSTGTPKMIVRSHRSFFHRLNWTWSDHSYANGEVCCQKSFMTTTHAIYELFEPLLRGVPVLILSDDDARNLGSFWDTITARGVSRLLIVPSVLQASLDIPGFVPPPLAVVVLMGEYVHPKLAERTIAAFPTMTRIFSIYGSTEASSTLLCDVRESFRSGEELPLGRPISPDVDARVLGTTLRPVTPGDLGMLHIAGPALFTEYLRDPALTASVFVAAPEGGRLYDTHDQVRLTADGNLEFVGRIDHTVKIRGFRVDLQEVERALLLHPAISQAGVVVKGNDAGTSMLLGFYGPSSVDQAGVFQLLRERLPGYMVPSVLVGLDSFPRTSSGKIDRLRLLEEYDHRTPEEHTDRGTSETERKILEVWKGILKHDDVRAGSSFFEVGGTSLSVFAALHRLREAFALDRSRLADQAIYRFPTVEALAKHIDGLRLGTSSVAPATDAILVTLKQGKDPGLEPFFVISSAGGTLGAYQKLSKCLTTRREVVGIRDPFIFGERDPTAGFYAWVSVYTEAIRKRQPKGPYHLGAYSSASAFGYEIAQQLASAGERVAVLALIDPLALDCLSKRRFGYWAFKARLGGPILRRGTLLAAALRPTARSGEGHGRPDPNIDAALSKEEVLKLGARAKTSRNHILGFSALLELNSGLPFGLDPSEIAGVEPDRYLAILLAKVKTVAPEIDSQSLENMVVQYYWQTRAQHAYRLQRYDGKVVVFEPDGPHRGVIASQFRPFVRDLRAVDLVLGQQADRTSRLIQTFGERLQSHYVSMRDDQFVASVADELDRLL